MMGKDDESEDQTLEEAAGYANNIDHPDFYKIEPEKDTDDFLSEIKIENEEEEEINGHKIVKRISKNDYSSPNSAILNNFDSDYENYLLIFENCDGNVQISWDVKNHLHKDDFLALCYYGKNFKINYYIR